MLLSVLRCRGDEAVTEAVIFREIFQNCFGDFIFKAASYPGRDSGGFSQSSLSEDSDISLVVIVHLGEER